MSAEGRAEPPQPSRCSALPAPPAHHGQEARRAVAADGAVGQAAAAQALDLLLGFLQHPTALGVLLLQVPQLRAQAQLRHSPIGDGAGPPLPPAAGAPMARPSPGSPPSGAAAAPLLPRPGAAGAPPPPSRTVGRSGQVRELCPVCVPPPASPWHGQGTLTVRHFCCRSTTCARSWLISSCCRTVSSVLRASSSER